MESDVNQLMFECLFESGECGHKRSRLLSAQTAEGRHKRTTTWLMTLASEVGQVSCPEAINLRGGKGTLGFPDES
jgi:hypothetical protein